MRRRRIGGDLTELSADLRLQQLRRDPRDRLLEKVAMLPQQRVRAGFSLVVLCVSAIVVSVLSSIDLVVDRRVSDPALAGAVHDPELCEIPVKPLLSP